MAVWRGALYGGLGYILLAAIWAAGPVPAAANGLMATGGLTSQPIGHYEFCRAHPSECAIHERNLSPVAMSAELWKQINVVNRAVNAAIKPMSDMDIYGQDEVWAYPAKGVGDCEDYVLEKRRRLAKDGVSLSDLLITVVRKQDGEGHAVLTLRTDQGDFILDNLSDKVKPWTETNYQYLKRQASFDTGRWVSLRESNNLLVSAVEE